MSEEKSAKKKKAKLPGLMQFFCVCLVFGLLSSIGSFYQMSSFYSVLWNTPYAWICLMDIGVFLIGLFTSFMMLAEIMKRERSFLIFFWINVCCRFLVLLVMFFMSFDAEILGSYMGNALVPLIWALYFYRSAKFERAFPPSRSRGPFFASKIFQTIEGAPVLSQTPPPSSPSGPISAVSKPSPAASSPVPVKPCPAPTAESQIPLSSCSSPSPSAPPSSPRFCKYCGTEYGPNDSHCPSCGRRVRFVLRIPCSWAPPFSIKDFSSAFRSLPFRNLIAAALCCFLSILLTFFITAVIETFSLRSSSGSSYYEITYTAETLNKNHVGQDWKNTIYINGAKLENGQKMLLSNKDTHRIRVEMIEEDSSYPDIGITYEVFYPPDYTIDELLDGAKVNCYILVKEHNGPGASTAASRKAAVLFQKTLSPGMETGIFAARCVIPLAGILIFFIYFLRHSRSKK